MSYESQEADAPIAFAGRRCADCGMIKPHAGDGRCSECLSFRTVPVRAHVPAPRWTVTVFVDGVQAFKEPFADSRAVDHVRDLYGAENVKIEPYQSEVKA